MTQIQLHNRLRRVEGQLQKIRENIDNNQDCAQIIPQFLAVKGAIAGAFDEFMKISLDSCAKSDEKKVKELITLLVKS